MFKLFRDMEKQQPQGVSPFPLPPLEYIKLYSDANLINAPAPPMIPAENETYEMFGQTIEELKPTDPIIQPLSKSGFEQLYPDNCDAIQEMVGFKILKILNFLVAF